MSLVFNTIDSTTRAQLVVTGGRSALSSTNRGVFKLEFSLLFTTISYFIDCRS
jgi:hypothetical protein